MPGLEAELRDYLRRASRGKVVLLEGKSDPQTFFALLGVPHRVDGVHDGVLVVGLGDSDGSGSTAVRKRIEFAEQTPGLRERFIGILDSDGAPPPGCAAALDPGVSGNLRVWPTYCIENLLAETGWPAALGTGVDLAAEMLRYAGYVALHRLTLEVRPILETLHLLRRAQPYREPFLTADEIQRALERDQARLSGYEIALRFRQEVERFTDLLQTDPRAAHGALDGKWLVEHLAVQRCGRGRDGCRDVWCDHARAQGGHPEVRAMWRRITGQEP